MARKANRSWRASWLSVSDHQVLAHNMAVIAGADMPLAQVLRAEYLEGAPRRRRWGIRQQVDRIVTGLEEGDTLSAAMRGPQTGCAEWEAALVEAGERSGRIPRVLEAWADLLRWHEVVSGNVRGGLIYPIVLFWLLIPFSTIILWKVVPTLATLYEGLGRAFPPMGRIFVGTAKSAGMWGSTILLLAGALVLLGWLAKGVPFLHRFRDGLFLRLPVAGSFALWRGRALTLEILAAWIEAGGALHEGVRQAARAQPNAALAAELRRAARLLEEGEDLPAPRRRGVFDGRTLWALRTALAGSDAARTCRRLAAREAVTMELRARRNVLRLEILGLAVMAALVAVVVIGVYTTLFGMIQWVRP